MIHVSLLDLNWKDAPETDDPETDDPETEVTETDGADGWRRDGRCALSTFCMALVAATVSLALRVVYGPAMYRCSG